MPDPWGGDNMSDEYAPHTARPTGPAAVPGPNGVPVLHPWFADMLGRLSGIPISARRPDSDDPTGAGDTDFDRLVTAGEDLVHVVVNNVMRASGVAADGRVSEITHSWSVELLSRVRDVIVNAWVAADEEKRLDQRVRADELEKVRAATLDLNARRRGVGLPELPIPEGG